MVQTWVNTPCKFVPQSVITASLSSITSNPCCKAIPLTTKADSCENTESEREWVRIQRRSVLTINEFSIIILNHMHHSMLQAFSRNPSLLQSCENRLRYNMGYGTNTGQHTLQVCLATDDHSIIILNHKQSLSPLSRQLQEHRI